MLIYIFSEYHVCFRVNDCLNSADSKASYTFKIQILRKCKLKSFIHSSCQLPNTNSDMSGVVNTHIFINI